MILYIGNIKSHYGSSPGTIEVLGKNLENSGLTVCYAGYNKNKLFRLVEMLFKTFHYRNKITFILIDTYSTTAFWYAYAVGYLSYILGLRYIPILHGGNLPSRISKSRFFSNRLFGQAFINVAVSQYLLEVFKKEGYKVKLIPNSIDISHYPFKERNNPSPHLLWVRAFAKIYNPLMALEVFTGLLNFYPNAKLCMVGHDKDGSKEEFVKRANQLGVLEKINITGYLSKKEWIELSQEYDVFINTTTIDNTPVSVIEAMALGLLVVSTNPGGIVHLLDHDYNSLHVNSGDSASMVEMIKAAIENKSKYDFLTHNARKKVESFDWESVKPLWLQLLNEKCL